MTPRKAKNALARLREDLTEQHENLIRWSAEPPIGFPCEAKERSWNHYQKACHDIVSFTVKQSGAGWIDEWMWDPSSLMFHYDVWISVEIPRSTEPLDSETSLLRTGLTFNPHADLDEQLAKIGAECVRLRHALTVMCRELFREFVRAGEVTP